MMLALIIVPCVLIATLVWIDSSPEGKRYRLILDDKACLAASSLGLKATAPANGTACTLETETDFSLNWIFLGQGGDIRMNRDHIIAAQKIR